MLDRKAMQPYDRIPRTARLRLTSRGGKFGIGAWRSLVAHLLWEQRVGSSNLSAPTNLPTSKKTIKARTYGLFLCPSTGRNRTRKTIGYKAIA